MNPAVLEDNPGQVNFTLVQDLAKKIRLTVTPAAGVDIDLWTWEAAFYIGSTLTRTPIIDSTDGISVDGAANTVDLEFSAAPSGEITDIALGKHTWDLRASPAGVNRSIMRCKMLQNACRSLLSLFFLLFVGVLLSSCAMQTEVNRAIAASNSTRFSAYVRGMTGCGDDAACQVGLSMAFAGGLGQQQFYREDSAADLLRAGVPYFDITDRMVSRLVKSSRVGDSSGLVVLGDNNTVSGVGNKLTATEGSSTSLATEQSINRPSAVSYGAGDTTLTPEVVTVSVPAEEVPIE